MSFAETKKSDFQTILAYSNYATRNDGNCMIFYMWPVRCFKCNCPLAFDDDLQKALELDFKEYKSDEILDILGIDRISRKCCRDSMTLTIDQWNTSRLNRSFSRDNVLKS